MSMLQYPLYNFLATVPKCGETSTLVAALEIFEQEQCDRLVVVNQQREPIGLLNSARLTQKLLAESPEDQYLNLLQQPLSIWKQSTFEPLHILAASDRVEQFVQFLRYYPSQSSNNVNWTLIDAEGKFLGLLDSTRLLRLLAQEKSGITTAGKKYSKSLRASGRIDPEYLDTAKSSESKLKAHWRLPRANQRQPLLHKSLIKLLEQLPWPLMLQTSTGEIVTQNPAWWQQLGVLKDPEDVRQQVAAILSPAQDKHPEYASQKAVRVAHSEDGASSQMKLHSVENTWAVKHETLPNKNLLPQSPSAAPTVNHLQESSISPANTFNRCYLDSQMGTCTCVVEEQNGQERIWQFAKILLDSPEFKVLNAQPGNSDYLWLVLATDVTEQQQLCKELAAKNADLIQLNRLKDEFLACISHELKTPLTAVLGLSRLLVDQQLGKLNERQARYAGLIHQSGRHLMSVVNDILDLTRMETGQMELTPAPVNIRAVCDRAQSEVKAIHTQNSKTLPTSQAPATNSSVPQFTLTIEPGLDQMVADELRLRQMLIHLLSNAFKFTETSGEIGLRVSRWEGWIAFTIWDTGIGIPEHQQHLIFQKFQQLENPLTRQFEGTGLGLVLTRALARLHGGDVSFLSQEGKGSQFTLLLPPCPPTTGFADSETSNQEAETQQNIGIQKVPISVNSPITTTTQHHAGCSQRLVLVVEAVARYIEDLAEQIKGLGYRVIIARSGTEAVEKARRLQPQAVFLNPLLPLLSGWDVLTLLKSDIATRHIPVIVTATGAEKEQAFANQADGFLSLPIENQALAPLLEKLCATPTIPQSELDCSQAMAKTKPLRILRLVNPELLSINPHPSLQEHRVIEVDSLDQAELLARVWQFDVILLDVESSLAQTYLQQLIQYPRLVALPLVTCDVATSLAASQIPGLSVFPCLIPLGQNNKSRTDKIDPLLSVLQIASGICCPPSILVVDLTTLHDLPQIRRKQVRNYRTLRNSALTNTTAVLGTEWFQALIQYLQTAGLKAAIGRCWAEVNQQIRHKTVDLLLICLGESPLHQDVLKALKALQDSSFNLPPILVLDQRSDRYRTDGLGEIEQHKNSSRDGVDKSVSAIATEILPRSISMEDLLHHINQALFYHRQEKS
ncbi:hybrid sensor histidine kinase/response regulator [Fortiea sp. LEGE XX443]|uniref:ATP-binding response regulator n=1 Tax=Fortiea sp. LEGE XX443 TaxID=1828611 RepID=UPI0018815A84|nr:ATP-binding protein [Fortiea sp. LEGE XX443]MBE9005250.1 hybrid sensor histidine kinase/response regulator [Fortiea sp. LEGE XX443]